MTSSTPRQVTYLPLSELPPDPRNPKAHDLPTIDASIGRFGVLDPIVQDGRTGLVVSGHGRKTTLQAMQDRGEAPPEGVQVGPSGAWLVPVVTGWASRTDTEAGAALIALNRTTELGGWVDDALLELLDELSEFDGGLAGVGFDGEDIDHLTRLAELTAEVDAANAAGASGDTPEGTPGGALEVLPDGHSQVTVIYAESSRSELYSALAELPYVLQVRDKVRNG